MRERAPVPGLIICPRCEGQRYDRGSCGFCANTGYLREDGERLRYAEQIQILSTLALATGIALAVPESAGSGQ